MIFLSGLDPSSRIHSNWSIYYIDFLRVDSNQIWSRPLFDIQKNDLSEALAMIVNSTVTQSYIGWRLYFDKLKISIFFLFQFDRFRWFVQKHELFIFSICINAFTSKIYEFLMFFERRSNRNWKDHNSVCGIERKSIEYNLVKQNARF